ncbi:MAG: deoxyribose-phosphate aldolase [Ilumatobacteraceae bacterium]
MTDARRILSLIDLTDLGESCTDDDVKSLCERATTPYGSVAAVCVWPRFVPVAVAQLAGTGVRIATVVNFPTGDEPTDQVVATTRRALDDGADEIDLVFPYRAYLTGDRVRVEAVLDGVRSIVELPRHLKVILETGELASLEQVSDAARVAIVHGADFVKTSTGKSKVSATPEAVRVMLEAIAASGRPVGIKPSGGIRTVADAMTYLHLADDVMGANWATPATFRFGASGLLDAVLEVLDQP